jgi:hypothetical protein
VLLRRRKVEYPLGDKNPSPTIVKMHLKQEGCEDGGKHARHLATQMRTGSAEGQGELVGSGTLTNRFADFLDGILMNPHPGFFTVNRGGTGKNREAALFYFYKFNRVSGFQSELFSNVKGKSNPAVEGNHC